jgi:hypothetical protein
VEPTVACADHSDSGARFYLDGKLSIVNDHRAGSEDDSGSMCKSIDSLDSKIACETNKRHPCALSILPNGYFSNASYFARQKLSVMA